MTIEQIAIYVHVPFCRAKCHYCDFASHAGMGELMEPYVEAVAAEAARLGPTHLPQDGPAEWRARTVYFGGGTPTLLSLSQFERLMAALPPRLPGAEVTVEGNPATVTVAFLRELRALGVNRLSLGVQSFDDVLLRRLGRLHSAAEAAASYEMARQAGFDDVSLDLIYGLPGQDLANWQATLRRAIELQPEHLSLYGLTVEHGTRFGYLHGRGQLAVPDEDAQADMYVLAEELLAEAGYEHYEISNWAAHRRGETMYAQHNLVYWRNEPYLGLGVAAHSWLRGRRFANTPDVRAYIAAVNRGQAPLISEEEIGPELEMAETMMLGLRLTEGVTFERFTRRFGGQMLERYGKNIAELTGLGLLTATVEGVALSPRGRLLGNEVFVRFLSQEAAML